jgi:hypothetical protein
MGGGGLRGVMERWIQLIYCKKFGTVTMYSQYKNNKNEVEKLKNRKQFPMWVII